MATLREHWTPTRVLRGRHPIHTSYELLPGDLLSRDEWCDVWVKEAPGLCIRGFQVDPLADGLLAVRVIWLDSTSYMFAPTVVHPQVAESFGVSAKPPHPTDTRGRKLVGEWVWIDGVGWAWQTRVE